MKYILNSVHKPMDIMIDLVSKKPDNIIKTVVYDAENKDLILERTDVFSGKKQIVLKLPITSNKIIIETFSKDRKRQPLGMDQSFELLNPRLMPLKTFNVDLGSGDKEFMKFITSFVTDLPSLSANGKLRRSPSGKFKIVLFDILKSKSGEVLNTPCMVGKKTGTIEVSKQHFLKMSQSQRIATLTHEYGHFYKNPLMGLDIGDEIGADLNGMSVHLGSGFGMSEYMNAFKKVFNNAKTDQNRNRYKVMKDFAEKIYNGEYFNNPYNL